MTARLRTRAHATPQDLAADVDDQLATLVTHQKVTVVSQYTEPMYVTLEAEPFGISAVRVRQRDNPEATVAHGQRVSFVWEGDRARIVDIDGMGTGATFYIFDFEVTL